jgi:hypothetical protein
MMGNESFPDPSNSNSASFQIPLASLITVPGFASDRALLKASTSLTRMDSSVETEHETIDNRNENSTELLSKDWAIIKK